jgi:hypothetical protein
LRVTSNYQPGLLAIVELCLDDTLFDRIKLNRNRNSGLSGIPNKDLEIAKAGDGSTWMQNTML